MDRYVCEDCGYSAAKWFGRCPDCGRWSSAAPGAEREQRLEIASLGAPGREAERLATDFGEVDRVLGGGFVRGGTILLAGEPGIGKSTLLLQILDSFVRSERSVLLVTGEESLAQVSLRAARLGLQPDRIRAAASNSLPAVLDMLAGEAPDVLAVDSIQTLSDPDLHPAGGLVQVREATAALVRAAKATGTVVVMVGHVTKDGDVAGPKALEHAVDTVLTLEGERTGTLRLLRAAKNRFGSCEETGVFSMNGRGLEPVPDASAMFLADRRPGVPGSAVFAGLEGTRPMLVEIQALVTDAVAPQPRRVAIGTDARRLHMLIGTLGRHAEMKIGSRDVFAAVAGGLSVRETAADLALCLALASAISAVPLPPETICVGEVGLAGEVRRVPGLQRRLSEAARMGFTRALVPRTATKLPAGMEAVECHDLGDALGCLGKLVPVRSVAKEPSW